MVATVNASTSAGVVITPDNSGVLAFQSSSATALTIDASQNSTFVGTASATKLIPTGSSATGNGLYLPAANSLGLSTNGTNAVYIDSSQNVGIGTSSPARRFHFKAAGVTTLANSNGALFTDASNAGVLLGSDNVLGYIQGVTAAGTATVNLVLQPFGGKVLVNTTGAIADGTISTSFAGNAVNGATFNDTTNASGSGFVIFTVNGTTIGNISRVSTTNAVAYNTTSDERLKSNIADSQSVLDKLMDVRVRKYDWTEGDLHQDYGFIAQELEPVLSGIVTKGKTDEDMWQLDYSRLTPHLVKAIQELKAINDTQAELISGQAATITALTARIVALETI
jgi:hypothetical protein